MLDRGCRMQEGAGAPAAGIIPTRRSSSRRDLPSSAWGTIVMTEPRPDCFAWMLDRRRFRPSLRMIARAVRGGVIETAPAGHRRALVDGLEALLDAPDLTTREAERLARLLAALDRIERGVPVAAGPDGTPMSPFPGRGPLPEVGVSERAFGKHRGENARHSREFVGRGP